MSAAHQLDIRYSYRGLPTLREFASSDAFIRGLVGPFGSGKSSACIAEFPMRAQEQAPGPDGVRRTRWAAVRSTYRELEDSTIRSFHQWLPPQHFGRWYEQDKRFVIKAFQGCEFEVLFRALDKPDDVKKLLSTEFTGAWVNEARETPWAIVDALQGRVGRYPPRSWGGPTWFGIWMDTNPPDIDSEWYKFFEDRGWLKSFLRMQEEGIFPRSMMAEEFAAIFKQPSGRSPLAENIDNLPLGYYHKLAVGKSDEWIKVYVDGQYGFVSNDKLVYPQYSDEVHCKKVEPIEGITIYRGWDFGLCYDDKTEVLTASGWKFFKDVDVEVDAIASRNPATGEMGYSRAAFKVAENYDGEMLEWASTEVNFCVTPEHRVPFSYRDSPKKVHWQSAEWLSKHMSGHHYVDLVSSWSAERGAMNAPALIWGMEPMAFAEFAALYLAEGATWRNRVIVYQSKQLPEMQRILDATGLPWKWFSHGKTSGWRVTSRELIVAMSISGQLSARFKRTPTAMRLLGPHHARAFLRAYAMGDGHKRTRKNGSIEETIFTSSRTMAGDLQDLAQKAGWNSSMRIVKPQRSMMGTRAIVNTGGFSICLKKTATRAELLKRNFKRIPYKGKVYCLNVPHHTLYVRRNGKPSWNGNTPACSMSQLLPDGRFLTFDEICATSLGVDKFSDDVLDHCSRSFNGRAYFQDYGDPAGNSRVQTDERTCFGILRSKGVQIEPGLQDPTIRWESVRRPLTKLVNGQPQFILHPRCRQLRKGFLGGYHFRRLLTTSERYSDRAEKNNFSHVHDALQYVATILFGAGLTADAMGADDWPDGSRDRDESGRSEVTGY